MPNAKPLIFKNTIIYLDDWDAVLLNRCWHLVGGAPNVTCQQGSETSLVEGVNGPAMVIVLHEEHTEWDSDTAVLPGLAVSLHVDGDPVVLREVDAGGGVVLPQSLQILLLPTVVGRHPGLVSSETSTTSCSPKM